MDILQVQRAFTQLRAHSVRCRKTVRRGFTLAEAAIAIVLVSVTTMGLLELSSVCTMQNRAANQTTTAVELAEQIREMLADLPLNDNTVGSTNFGDEAGETLASYDDVDDFDGLTFDPPIDASRTQIQGMDGYSQSITINPISATSLSGAVLSKSTYTGTVRVTIAVNRLDPTSNTAAPVYSTSFLRVEE